MPEPRPTAGSKEANPQAEIQRLNRIILALMDRAERSTESQGSDFTLFQTSVMLEEKVRSRTAELEASLRANDKINRALRESEEMFAKIFQMSPDSIDLTRLADGVYVNFNNNYTKLFGYPAAELIGRSTSDLGIWLNREDQQRHLAHLLEQGEVVAFEAPLRRKDGRTFFAQISSSVLEIDGGRYNLNIVRDITRQKQAEEARRYVEAQLLQTQKMESIGSLAGGIAHDMNNVLGAILGLASVALANQPDGSQTRQILGTIVKAAERGGVMVKGLLSLARQRPAEECEVDLNQIIKEEIRLLEHTTLSKVRLEMDLVGDLRPIRGDAAALTHAIMNLCVNAVDAMSANGTLTLRSRNLDSDWIELRVEDTGSGMTPEVLRKAVDPFFTTKEQGKGTGLGLSMTYNTVTAHQGQMEIQSTPGQGTCVRIRLPTCAPGPRDSEPGAKTHCVPAQRPLSLLVVDDDELVRYSTMAILDALGHQAMAVASGEEAIQRLEAGFQPEVVILDLNMPGLGGIGTLPHLGRVPVLLATGRADQATLDLIRDQPNVTLLPKPFNMRDLQKTLERIRP